MGKCVKVILLGERGSCIVIFRNVASLIAKRLNDVHNFIKMSAALPEQGASDTIIWSILQVKMIDFI